LLLCVFNIAGVLFYEPLDGVPTLVSLVAFGVIFGFIAAVSFVVIWFFWRGRNWARWLVLATSVLALLNVLLIPSSNLAAQFLIGVEAAVAVWLLYWLNTEDVSRYFKRFGKRANTLLRPTSGGGASSSSTPR
jgi:O-antigen/teichoic acid export membrane protein